MKERKKEKKKPRLIFPKKEEEEEGFSKDLSVYLEMEKASPQLSQRRVFDGD